MKNLGYFFLISDILNKLISATYKTYGFSLDFIFNFQYFFIDELAKIKFGSKNIFEDLTVLIDLNAKIAIGNSVQPKNNFFTFFFY